MIEADIHHRLLQTSLLDIYKECLSHWHAVSWEYGRTFMPLHRRNWPQKCHFWSENDVITSWLRHIMVEADIHLRSLHALYWLELEGIFNFEEEQYWW